MALINSIIPDQNYEIIRNRIGEILAVELINQAALTSIPNVTAVDVERFVPPDETEFPLATVEFAGGTYANKDQTQSQGTYVYYITIHASGRTNPDTKGDKAAAIKLHRILGLCRAILENPAYNRLGFDKPTTTRGNISSTKVESIKIPKTEENGDATNSIFGYLEFHVKAPEGVQLSDPIPLASGTTVVKLYLTDKGYRWGPDGGELQYFLDERTTSEQLIYFIAE